MTAVRFLCLLFFAAALTAGALARRTAYLRFEDRLNRETQRGEEIRGILSEVLADLYGDPSPEVNDPGDPVWAWDGREIQGCTVSVTPLSDRLNPNFIRKNLLENTALGRLLRPGKTPADLQQFREDNGLSLAPGAYADFFEENAGGCVSPYGWANINLADEFALRKLVFSLTAEAHTADYARAVVQRLLIDRRIAGSGDLRSLFGVYYEDLFPFINAEPLMNVNFLEPFILRELAAYPGYGIPSPERRSEELLLRREQGGIGRPELRSILGIGEDHLLNQYLGSVTWFWEITVTGHGYSGRAVVCRLPLEPAELSPEIRFNIIEQRFKRCS